MTTFSTCPNVCGNYAGVQCSDPISVIVQAIMDLAETKGSLATAIITESQSICSTLTSTAILEALTKGVKRGIFLPIYASVEVLPTYMVNANMTAINFRNRIYDRPACLGGTNTFWVPARNAFI